MEINLHVCPPELGLTASLAMLGLCKRFADLDRFRPSSSFSDWQRCNRGSTETYHNILCNSSRFHSFCYLLQQHQNKFLLPYLYLFQKLLLQLLPLGKGKENKISFHTTTTLQWHRVIEYIYSALPHFWRRGNTIVRGHCITMPRTRQQAKWRCYTANHVQMELTFYSRVRA